LVKYGRIMKHYEQESRLEENYELVSNTNILSILKTHKTE